MYKSGDIVELQTFNNSIYSFGTYRLISFLNGDKVLILRKLNKEEILSMFNDKKIWYKGLYQNQICLLPTRNGFKLINSK